MAQTIKSATLVEKFNVGGRTATLVELVLGTEYLTEGFVVDPKEHLFLTDGLLDVSFVTVAPTAAKNVKVALANMVVTNAGGGKAEACSAKLQLYSTKTLKENEIEALLEVASKSETYKEAVVFVLSFGR